MPFIYMRRHQKALLWIIVIVIVPTFCLLGAYYGRGRGRATAGYVMGRKISRWQFEDVHRRWFRTNRLFGRGQDLDEQQMWNEYRTIVAADLWGIRVPDKKVVEHVKQTFAGRGAFDIEAVEDIFRARGRGLTLDGYEQTTREMLMQRCLIRSIAGAAKVTDDEAKHMYRFEEALASVSLVRFKAKDFKKDVRVDAGEVRHFFSRRSEDYRVPEKFRFEYVAVKLKDLEEKTEITDDEARKYYNDNKGLYLKPPEADKSDQEGEDAKEEKKEEKEEYKPLEDVREDIEGVLKKQKVVDVAVARLDEVEQKIEDLSKTQSMETIDLKKLADELGLMYTTTNALTAGELYYHEDLGSRRDRIDYLCRGLDVGNISFGIKGYTSHFVARPLEKRESYVPDFSDVENEVRADFIHTEAAVNALNAATNFAELVGEISFDDVAKKQGLKTEAHGPFNRFDASSKIGGATWELATRIFATPVGEITEVVVCGSDAVVAKVTGREEPDWDKFEEKKKALVLRYRQAKTREVIPQWFRSVETTFFPRKSNDTP